MILGENVGSVFSEGREIQKVYSYGKLVWEKKTDTPDVIDYSTMPFTIKAIDGAVSVVVGKVNLNDGGLIAVNYMYSINGGEWKSGNGTLTKINANDEISIISNDIEYCRITGDYIWVGMRQEYAVSDIYGNIMSLRYGDNFIGQTVWKEIKRYWANSGFFSGNIRNAKDLILPATTLSKRAYNSMFFGMTSLLTPPDLPATTLAEGCYSSMFYGCTNLLTAPVLPAKTLVKGCYGGMFAYCTSLKYLKCYATDFDAESIDKVVRYYDDENKYWVESNKWLSGIKTSGTLVCKHVDGGKNPLEEYIPSTWSVEYID